MDGGDAEVFVAAHEAGAGCGEMCLGIRRDGGVAIQNYVVVRHDAVGVDLCSGEPGGKEGYKNNAAEESARKKRCIGSDESGYAGSGLAAVGHGAPRSLG